MFEPVKDPYWDDRPLVIVAGGPSLRNYDLSDLRNRGRVVLLNDAVMFCKGHVLFSMDANWIMRSAFLIDTFVGEEVWLAVSEHHMEQEYQTETPVRYLKKMSSTVTTLSKTSDQIYCSGNAGFAVLNLALLKRARKIYLLGYDLGRGVHEQWHDAEEMLGLPKRIRNPLYYSRWAQRIAEVSSVFVEQGIRIINCNPGSSLKCFEFSSYEDFGLSQLVETSTN